MRARSGWMEYCRSWFLKREGEKADGIVGEKLDERVYKLCQDWGERGSGYMLLIVIRTRSHRLSLQTIFLPQFLSLSWPIQDTGCPLQKANKVRKDGESTLSTRQLVPFAAHPISYFFSKEDPFESFFSVHPLHVIHEKKSGVFYSISQDMSALQKRYVRPAIRDWKVFFYSASYCFRSLGVLNSDLKQRVFFFLSFFFSSLEKWWESVKGRMQLDV